MGQPGPHGASLKEPVTLRAGNVSIAIDDEQIVITVVDESGTTRTTIISRATGKVTATI